MQDQTEAEQAGRLPPVLSAVVNVAADRVGASLAWSFLHPPRRLHAVTPRSMLGVAYERLRLTAADGIPLAAWFVPAPTENLRALVVICHGYTGNRATMLPYLKFLHNAGFAAVLFDFRAHGWSGGTMTTFGCREPLDLRAALDWINTRPDIKDLPLVVVGESMGAAVSLLVAADEPRIQAVVADSPYARFDSAVEGRLRSALGKHIGTALRPPAQRAGERFLGVRCADIAPVEAVVKIAPRPVFLIHGADDKLILPENTVKILEAAPGNAKRWVVPGARHVRSVYVAGDEYAERVLAFLNGSLDKGNLD